MNRRNALQQIGALALLASPASIVLGHSITTKDLFETLKTAVSTNASGKIEVLEFFQYTCSHCMDFDPLIKQWIKRLPKDVVFAQVPMIWRGPDEGFARLHYALLATKQTELHEKVFVDVQENRLPLHTEEGVREWARANKLDVPTFMKTYSSTLWVDTQVKRAIKLASDYKIQSVPTMAVAGRFLTSASLTGSHEATLEVVDSLIERARKHKP